jgi:hypothetical protein
MQEIILAVDVILQAIIGRNTSKIDDLILEARNGDAQLQILDSALYCALYSVKGEDKVNVRRLAELLQYAQLISDSPEYLGPEERESWIPSQEEIDNWRKVALGEN